MQAANVKSKFDKLYKISGTVSDEEVLFGAFAQSKQHTAMAVMFDSNLHEYVRIGDRLFVIPVHLVKNLTVKKKSSQGTYSLHIEWHDEEASIIPFWKDRQGVYYLYRELTRRWKQQNKGRKQRKEQRCS